MARCLCPVFIALLALASCRTTPGPPHDLTSRDVAELSPKSGNVSAELLADASSPGVELGPGEEFAPAALDRQNRSPQYPSHLIDRNVPQHVIVVRITFDEKGLPSSITPSPLRTSTQSAHTADFHGAVVAALNDWSCIPARIRKFRDGPDSDADGKADFRIMTAQKTLKTFFDVSFVFDVVNGQPVVRRSP